MTNRARRLGTTLAIAALMALLVSAVPAGVATAANPRACLVMNLDQGFVRSSLQRAVVAASPGDHLVVRGTCVGSTLITKDLRITGSRVKSSAMACDERGRCTRSVIIDSGPATLRSRIGRPTLVIDPSVDDLVIDGRLRIRGQVRIGPI